jgi:hypothetical protein
LADQDIIPLSVAAVLIGTPERPCDPDVVRKRAAALGLLRKMPDGRLAITRQLMREFRRNYRACGFLMPRAGRRSEENRKAAAIA